MTARDPETRRQALFITPVMPATTGSGIAMRAGMTLQALASEFDISVLCLPVLGSVQRKLPRDLTGSSVRRVIVHRVSDDPAFTRSYSESNGIGRAVACALYPRPLLARFGTESNVESARKVFQTTHFDLVHTLRLYLTPFALPYLGTPSTVVSLDCDDYESQTMRRLAELHLAAGDPANGALARSEAVKYSQWETKYLPCFDRVCVTCEPDRRALSEACPQAKMAVVPNVARLVDNPRRPPGGDKFTFLFLGNMSYLPNEDASVFFCREVLPLLRNKAANRFDVLIAGAHPPRRVKELERHPEVRVVADIPDVRQVYEKAHAAVVPLRWGGGTKIKVLEALGYRRAVVSTPAGVTGLEIERENQVLVGDRPEQLAAQCLRLVEDRGLADRIAGSGYEWVRKHHSPEVFRDALLKAVGGIPEPGG